MLPAAHLRRAVFVFICLLIVFSNNLVCQTTVGIQPFGSYTTSLDKINVGTLNTHIEIPLYTHKGRSSATDVVARLTYDAGALGLTGYVGPGAQVSNGGWSLTVGPSGGGAVLVSTASSHGSCGTNAYGYTYSYVDQTGYKHFFPGISTYNPCTDTSAQPLPGLPVAASDGSGYLLVAASGLAAQVTTPSGITISNDSLTDTNGNAVPGGTFIYAGYPLTFGDYLSVSGSFLPIQNPLSDPNQPSVGSTILQYRDPNGSLQNITISSKRYPITGASTGGSIYYLYLVDSVSFPDGTAYHFSYESSASSPGQYTGRIASLEVPTGGAISYQYGETVLQAGRPGVLTSLVRTTADGSISYTRNVTSIVDYVAANSNTTVSEQGKTTYYTFVAPSGLGDSPFETSRAIYQGSSVSGTPLESITHCYNGATGDCTNESFSTPVTQISESTSYNGGPSSKKVQTFNARSLLTELDEYDFGASSPTRKTITTYAPLGNNIDDRPDSVTVEDANGTTISKTSYGYDEYPVSPTSSSLPDHTAVSGNRGNTTSIKKWLNTANSTLDTHYEYDDAGQVVASSDALGHWTNFTYDSGTDSCLTNTAFPTPSSGVNQTTSAICDPNSGLVTSTTDLNGEVTHYGYDAMLRLTSTSYPDGGSKSVSYSGSSLPETITTTVASAPSPDEISTTTLDEYGRTSRTASSNGALVSTTYDSNGNVYSVSNPYFSTSDATYGTTTNSYDALGRIIQRTNPDGSSQQWGYSGNVTTFKDEAGNQWQRTTDALGRLTNVMEPGGIQTAYTYDLLDNLRGATQTGVSGETSRVRSFIYDSLSRLTSATNPESGTVGYTYDLNGNVLTKTDARGVTTGYAYDALNRVTNKQSAGANGVPGFNYTYWYDKSAPGGIVASNPIGRLTWASNNVNADIQYSYDSMGRVVHQAGCTPQDCVTGANPVSAQYDLAGNVTSLTYPDGRTISQTADTAGRLSSVNYANWDGNSHTYSYLNINSSQEYDPAGHLTNTTMGNGVSMAAAYDKRERLGALAYGTATQLLWGKQYGWTSNSNLQVLTDALTGVQRQFGYDGLNRLTSAQDILGPTQGANTSPFPTGSGNTSVGSSSGASPSWTDPDDSNVLLDPDFPGAGGWGVANATIMGGVVAPDGTPTAASFTATSGSTDTYLADGVPNTYLYYGETMTGSVWLRSPNGTITTNLYIVEAGAGGNTICSWKSITVTSNWQQFQLSGLFQNGNNSLVFQIGGAGTITNGQTLSLWGAKLEDTGRSGPSVTNFLPFSQRLTAGTWGFNDVTPVDNSAAAPDGTNTAASVTVSSGPSDGWFVDRVQNPAPFSGVPVTGSVWLRAPSGARSISITLIEVGTSGYSTLGYESIVLSGDWQRFQVSGTTQNTLTELQLQIGGDGSFTNGQSVQVWGAQMELGSGAGPYVATGASPVSIGTNLTNILPYSQQPNGPSWDVAGAQGVVNAVTAPDGSMTGYEMTALPGVTDAYATDDAMNPALYDGATVTGSIFMRTPSGAQTVDLFLAGQNAAGRTFLGSQAVQLTSQWQRFTVTGQMSNGLTRIFLQAAGGSTLSSGQKLDLWGAQLELASTAGPYVMTSALPVIAGRELTNILPNSQQFNGPSWGVSNGIATPSAATAPDGSNTAATVTANANSPDTYAIDSTPNPSLYDEQTVTASVYLRVPNGTLNTDLFLVNVGNAGWSVPAQIPVTLTTTWQRFSVTGTNQNGLTQLSLQIGGAGTVISGQSLQVWGTQMVVGSAAAPYDPTNGVTTSRVTGQPATPVPTGLNQTYSYDSFGNLQQNGSFNSSYTANNQMLGYAYDAAGNLLSNGLTTMTWDAESRLVSAGGATYVYDPEGNRVGTQGVGVTDTIYFGGRPIARYSAGQWTDLIYGPNGLLAEVPGTENAEPVYRLTDHLGSEIGTVTSNGILTNPLDYTPFGQIFSGSTNDHYMFTGKERDTEPGLDYFGARYYSSSMARFTSPDDGRDQVAEDPQSWNLYSYVQNNPLINIDPDGHDCVTQMATQGGGEQASVTRGGCSGAAGNGTTQTYIAGTVTSLSYASDGKSLNVGYNAYGSDPNTSASVSSLDRAPTPDNPGIALGYNQAGFAQLSNTSRVTSYFGNIGMALIGMGMDTALAGTMPEVGLAGVGRTQVNFSNALAHNIVALRGDHLPPPGTIDQVKQAVTAALNAGQYSTKANGAIEGTLTINGTACGFRGAMVNGVMRISTVFAKR